MQNMQELKKKKKLEPDTSNVVAWSSRRYCDSEQQQRSNISKKRNKNIFWKIM